MANELQLQMEIDGVRFKGADKGFNALLGLVAKPFSEMAPVAQRVIEDILDGVIDAMEQRHGAKFAKGRARPSGPGLRSGERTGKLQVRSGKMLADLKRSKLVKSTGPNEVTGRMVLAGHGAVHEVGATITPKKAKYLAIPFDAALKADGTPKKKKPRDWKDTFVLKSRKGNLIIMQKRRGGRLVPLYLLKKQVKIPPRLGLGVTLDAAGPVFVDRLFQKLVEKINGVRPRDAKGRFL